MKYFTNVRAYGNYIYYRYIENNKPYLTKEKFEPVLFKLTQEPTGLKSMDGGFLAPIFYDSIKEMKESVENHKDYGLKLFGINNAAVQFIQQEYPDGVEYQGDMMDQIRGLYLDIEVQSEGGFPKPELAEWPVTAISMYDTKTKQYYVLGQHPEQTFTFDPSHEEIGNLKVNYRQCANERELLMTFLQIWQSLSPDWYSGWNSDGFDMVYMYNRIIKLLGEKICKKLSPFGIVYSRKTRGKYSDVYSVSILGIESLDYLLLYKKHTYNKLPSYRLDYVAHHELGEKKLSYEESGNLKTLYRDNFQKYIEYNIQDTNLVVRLNNKLDFINVTYSISYYAMINYSETLKTVPAWHSMVYNYLAKDDVIPPINPPGAKAEQFKGAYVHIPNPGRYEWIVLIDLASMYPHIYQQWNLGPDTILEPNEYPQLYEKYWDVCEETLIRGEVDTSHLPDGVCLSANGYLFDTTKRSVFHKLMRELYYGRKANKKKQIEYKNKSVEIKKQIETEGETEELKSLKKEYDTKVVQYYGLQMSEKILMNSGYGAGGSTFFNYFDLRIAEAVTSGGQLAIKWIMDRLYKYFNEKLNTENVEYCIYSDTDSVDVECKTIVERFCKDKTTEEKIDFLDKLFSGPVKEFIDKSYEEMATYLNCAENRMFMDREIIAEKAIWTGKKRYTMSVWDDEGVRYPEPKFKIMGLDSVRSTVPDNCRKALEESYKICLYGTNDDLIEYVNKFKNEYMSWSIEEISNSSTFNNLKKYYDKDNVYKKGCPYHVKGALVYNKMIKEMGLEDKYELFSEGDSGKIVNLIKENPTVAKTFSFPTFFPRETGMEEFIDKDKMFNKAFIEPLHNLIDHIGWDHKKVIKISSFFS